MMMAFRRVETVVVQRRLGFIDRELTEGFDGRRYQCFMLRECVNSGRVERPIQQPLLSMGR